MGKVSKGWIWGAAIGAAAGAVTALLFAPKPGRELRKDIADGARQVGEKTQEIAEKVGEQATQLASKVKETAGCIADDFKAWRASGENADEADGNTAVVSSFEEEEVKEAAAAATGATEEEAK